MRGIERRTALPFPPALFAEITKLFERGRPEIEKLIGVLGKVIADPSEASAVSVYLAREYAVGRLSGLTALLDGVTLADLIEMAEGDDGEDEGDDAGDMDADELGGGLEEEDGDPPEQPRAA